MQHPRTTLITSSGEACTAIAPLIISASRATDIPACCFDWFLQRWQAGYCKWRNPFNNTTLCVDFAQCQGIVFWSKNPAPMLLQLPFLNDMLPANYLHYTLNDYESDRFEPNLPTVTQRIDTFIALSEALGKERIIWRFDPLILTPWLTTEKLLEKIARLGEKLHRYTTRLVISFADIEHYPAVKRSMQKHCPQSQAFTTERMIAFAAGLQQINRHWNLHIATCAESVDLETYGIAHNRCIDGDLLDSIARNNSRLLHHVQSGMAATRKDPGQRRDCHCIHSKDIGAYNTCSHGCIYCYANRHPGPNNNTRHRIRTAASTAEEQLSEYVPGNTR